MKTTRLYIATGLLALLAAACDRSNEVTDNALGKMIDVHVSILGVQEGQSEEIMRAASISPLTGRPEIISASQPLPNGMLLDMSLEPDSASPLRSIPLEQNKTFRVIALKTDGTYATHHDFVITSNTDNTDATFHVPENITHDFICISYNSTDPLPAADASFSAGTVAKIAISSAGTHDLLYGKTTKAITSTDKNLSFLLSHKLSKVKLIIDGSYNEWPVSSVVATSIYLKPNYRNAKMKLQDWSTNYSDKGSYATDQYFGNWSSAGDGFSQTSASLNVFTNNETISLLVPQDAVNINSGSQPSVETTVTFPGISDLAPGSDYTLRLRMRIPRWAGSNIYWIEETTETDYTTGHLTFDLEKSTGTNRHEGYQGVFFRFGSLVGISPALVSGDRYFSNAVPVYIPTYVAGPPASATWKSPNVSPYSTLTETATNGDPAPDTDPPYLDSRTEYNPVNAAYEIYVMQADKNTDQMYANLLGDICQFLGKTRSALDGYRLPMKSEFGLTGSHIDLNETTAIGGGWKRTGSFEEIHLGKPDGTADLSDPSNSAGKVLGLGINETMGIIFPTSGTRMPSPASPLHSEGNMGIYGSGSSLSSRDRAYKLYFGYDVYGSYYFVWTDCVYERGYASPVRCVVK
jgi:hypothetical protein